jgi:hypothetical protein
MDVTVNVSGPMFDDRAQAMVDRLVDEVQQEVADYALFQWRMNLEDSWREPTGAYMSHTNLARREHDLVTNDHGSLYGPWLEGTGSRNFPVTRFKGYAAARRATQTVARKAKSIGQPFVDKWVGRINSE